MNFTKRCLVCGTKITVISSRYKYCSNKCRHFADNKKKRYNTISMPVYFIKCANCQKLKTRISNPKGIYKYCSRECKDLFKFKVKAHKITYFNCKVCNKLSVSKKNTAETCGDCRKNRLDSGYIKNLMCRYTEIAKIPKSIIDLKRNTIKIKRKIKNKQL